MVGGTSGCLVEVLWWCKSIRVFEKRVKSKRLIGLGKSGAPGWTLELAGFDLSNDGEKLALSGAAFLDGIKGGRLGGDRGLWPTGELVISPPLALE